MKKLIKKLPSKAVTAMLAASGLLLLSGSVGGTRAALTYYSDTYSSQLSTQNIGVTLLENGERVSWRDYNKKKADGEWDEAKGSLLLGMPNGKDEHLKIGKVYDEQLQVENTGDIGEYVRVSISRYWIDDTTEKDEDGSDETEIVYKKNRDLDPNMIKLEFANPEVWIEDKAAETEEGAEPARTERTVLYYSKLLQKDEVTPAFVSSLSIDRAVVTMVTETVESKTTTPDGGTLTTIKSTYDYDGKQFVVEVEVDAVQEHNAQDAILSAWGRSVTISGDTLSLNEMPSTKVLSPVQD